jgi:parvulin-like peptidyl-prolyl isomerase
MRATNVSEITNSRPIAVSGLVIHVHLVEAKAEDVAQAALARIQAGEEFAVVAREMSTDTLTTDQGGDLGWLTTGQLTSRYGQEVEDAAFGLDVGQATKVQSGDSLYVIQVSERNENGPLPEDVVASRQNSALTDWLTERKASLDVKIEKLLTPEQIPPDPQESSTTP